MISKLLCYLGLHYWAITKPMTKNPQDVTVICLRPECDEQRRKIYSNAEDQ